MDIIRLTSGRSVIFLTQLTWVESKIRNLICYEHLNNEKRKETSPVCIKTNCKTYWVITGTLEEGPTLSQNDDKLSSGEAATSGYIDGYSSHPVSDSDLRRLLTLIGSLQPERWESCKGSFWHCVELIIPGFSPWLVIIQRQWIWNKEERVSLV